MTEIITWMTANIAGIMTMLGAVVAFASVISNFTDSTVDDGWVKKADVLLNWLALNFSEKAGK